MKTLSRSSSRLATAVGLVAAVLFWAVDLWIECSYFHPGGSCLNLLLHPEPSKLAVRLLASAIILLLIFQSTILLRHREDAEARLAHGSFLLEELTIELKQKNDRLQLEIARRKAMEQQLETLAVTDQLTGIYNRRRFDDMLNQHIRQEARYPRGLALLMLDIDRFKDVNDHLGHAAGDEVLRELARLISESKRAADDFFRIGGEEFCLITFSDGDGNLETTAEKLRQTVAEHTFPKAGRLTVSIGVTRFQPDDDYDRLFKRTDDALYLAKQTGRNKVVII
ncbi:MAG TPA: GGDEF domain-containing protein [Parasulfuritortus sp.]